MLRFALYVIECLFTTNAVIKLIFRQRFSAYLRAEFVHRVRCTFELIMIYENILSVPGVQLIAEDCMVYQSTVDLILGLTYLISFLFYFASLLRECFVVFFFIFLSFLSIMYFVYDLNNN